MKTNDLNRMWTDTEQQINSSKQLMQRMVYVEMLSRIYIGAAGIPAKRFLSIEIPKKDAEQFDSFTALQGFTLLIGNPSVKHDGYVACVLQAAGSDQNDLFAIVAEDILNCLNKENEIDKYVAALKKRIEKWRTFFKNKANKYLTDKTIIGLFGELTFIKELKKSGIDFAADLWNGPINAAQDFQGDRIAIEVKTASTNSLEYVHISSEEQLDLADRTALFLIVYRIERNDATGISLPELIDQVAELLLPEQQNSFKAKLTCLGYAEEDSAHYNKRYSIKECQSYRVQTGFPMILKTDLPKGIMDIKYKLSLDACEKFIADFNEISQALKEYEYGEN